MKNSTKRRFKIAFISFIGVCIIYSCNKQAKFVQQQTKNNEVEVIPKLNNKGILVFETLENFEEVMRKIR